MNYFQWSGNVGEFWRFRSGRIGLILFIAGRKFRWLPCVSVFSVIESVSNSSMLVSVAVINWPSFVCFLILLSASVITIWLPIGFYGPFSCACENSTGLSGLLHWYIVGVCYLITRWFTNPSSSSYSLFVSTLFNDSQDLNLWCSLLELADASDFSFFNRMKSCRSCFSELFKFS